MTKTAVKVNEYGDISISEDDEIISSVISSMARNNTFFPNITKIWTTKDDVLTMTFADGTWVSVKRSDDDPFDLTNAVLYAIAKRLFGKVTGSGYVDGDGFMGRIKGIVESVRTPQKAEQEKKDRIRAKEEADRVAHEEAVKRRKERDIRRKRDTDDLLSELCDLLKKSLSKSSK